MGIVLDRSSRRQQIVDRLKQNHNYSPVVLQRLVDFQLLLEAPEEHGDPLNEMRAARLAECNAQAKAPPKTAYKQAKEASIQTVSKQATKTLPEIAIRERKTRLKKNNTESKSSIDWRDPDHYHYTRLHKAVEARNLKEVIRIVEVQHANPYIKGNDHWTPLGLAVQLGFEEIVAYLRDK